MQRLDLVDVVKWSSAESERSRQAKRQGDTELEWDTEQKDAQRSNNWACLAGRYSVLSFIQLFTALATPLSLPTLLCMRLILRPRSLNSSSV